MVKSQTVDPSIKLQQSRLAQLYQLSLPSKKPPQPQPPIHATFAGESISDNFCVLTNQLFTKTWLIQNSGTAPWPLQVELTLEENERYPQLPRSVPINKRVFPGKYTEVKVEFRAPESAGKHVWKYYLTSTEQIGLRNRNVQRQGGRISEVMTVDINV